jgi:predicted permease
MRAALNRLLAPFGRRDADAELDEELRAHVEMAAEENRRRGMTDDEARREALRSFGGVTQVREQFREQEGLLWLENLRRDAGYALRQMRRSPGFAVVVIVTLALGIGATTAVFSVVEGVLLRPLPYQAPGRLVVIWQTDAAHRASGAYFNSYREFEVWERSSRSFESLAAATWAKGPSTVMWRGRMMEVLAIPVSANFFSMLGVQARMGRTFLAGDEDRGCGLVLAYPFWQQKLGAPQNIVGQSLTVGHTTCFVLGVMPKSFSFYPQQTEAWTLITPSSAFVREPWENMTGVFGRLRPGISRAAAEQELESLEAPVLTEAPPDLAMMRTLRPDVLQLQSEFVWLSGRNLREGLWMLLGAATLILLIACVNVGSLLLGRGVERERMMAVRSALGSGPRRLFAQAMTESLLLALFGAAAGSAVAEGLLRWFAHANPIELPPGATIELDGGVLLFTAVAGGIAAAAFGLVPAWRASRVDPNRVLRGALAGVTPGAAASRGAQGMVVVQVALSLVLVAGAGLLGQSLWKLASTPLGYRTDHLFTAQVHLPADRYADARARAQFAERLAESAATVPGVESVAAGSSYVPLGVNALAIESEKGRDHPTAGVAEQDVSASFFSTMKIPLACGRLFDDRDRENTQPVAIVNEALARRYFPGQDPLGQAIKLSRADDASQPWMTVVGVVADVKTTTVFQEMGYVEVPSVYRPLWQAEPDSLAIMIAARGQPQELTGAIEQRVAALDPALLLSDVDGLAREHSAEMAQPRFRTVLLGGFAALALALAAVGLYGILSQRVRRQTHDIGIRMALGARAEQVLAMVLREAAWVTAIGAVLGLGGTLMAGRLMASLLFGLQAWDPATLAGAAGLLLLVALLAALIPAHRAATVDPMRALRTE